MKNYLRNWNLMRIIRLALGIIVTIQGVQVQEWMLVVLGALFTLMPFFNIGCCTTTTGCNNTYSKRKNTKLQEVNYEEVKAK